MKLNSLSLTRCPLFYKLILLWRCIHYLFYPRCLIQCFKTHEIPNIKTTLFCICERKLLSIAFLRLQMFLWYDIYVKTYFLSSTENAKHWLKVFQIIYCIFQQINANYSILFIRSILNITISWLLNICRKQNL